LVVLEVVEVRRESVVEDERRVTYVWDALL